MKIYISGAITGTTDFMEVFRKVEEKLTAQGHMVYNPAHANSFMPDGTTYEEYMKVSFCLLDMADAIYMIDGWKKSKGATRELYYASALGKQILYENAEQSHGINVSNEEDKEKSAIIVPKTTVSKADIRRIMEKWNELQEFGIKPISGLMGGSKRYNNLVARIRQYGVDGVLSAIDRIKESEYCQGKNKHGWSIKFDWFILPSNFPKVLEGNYDNRSNGTRRSVFDEWRDS